MQTRKPSPERSPPRFLSLSLSYFLSHRSMDRPQEKDAEVGLQKSRTLAINLEEDCQNPIPGDTDRKYGGKNDKTPSLEVGMEFDSIDDGYDYYNSYAKKVGFGIRKDWKNKNKLGVVTRRKICCSREGLRKPDKRRPLVKFQRDATRTECKAHILLVLQPNGKYQIGGFEANHNHPCSPQNVCMFKSQRKKDVTQATTASGVDTGAQADNCIDIGSLSMNCKSYLPFKRLRSMKKGDAGNVLQYLLQMRIEDPEFFSSIQLDADDKITNIFWADAKMVMDYHAFGDVLCFSTFHKIHSFDRPFVSFIGVNHHKQMVVFGAALMYDETTESFKWLFEAFLDAMSNKHPKTILTDRDMAIANAIPVVFPYTYHRICVWHVYQDAVKNLGNVFSGSKSFNSDFKKCVYEYEEEGDFLEAWEIMLGKYDLRQNSWLQELFNDRVKWALGYERDTFCADIKTIQQSESMNVVLKRYLDHENDLLEFFSKFESLVSDKRKAEFEADCKMMHSFPILALPVQMLKDAMNVYTPELFKLFQEEYAKGMNCVPKICGEEGTVVTYKVACVEKQREYIVTFDSLEQAVSCSCKKFEFVGILCGHALRVIDHMGLREVPKKYILKRWRKDARDGSSERYENWSFSDHYKELMHKSTKLSTKAARNEETFTIVEHYLDKALEKVEELLKQASHCDPLRISSHGMNNEDLERENSCEPVGVSVQPSMENVAIAKPKRGAKRKERNSEGSPMMKRGSGESSKMNLSQNVPTVPRTISYQPNPEPSLNMSVQGAHQMNPSMHQQLGGLHEHFNQQYSGATQHNFHRHSHLEKDSLVAGHYHYTVNSTPQMSQDSRPGPENFRHFAFSAPQDSSGPSMRHHYLMGRGSQEEQREGQLANESTSKVVS